MGKRTKEGNLNLFYMDRSEEQKQKTKKQKKKQNLRTKKNTNSNNDKLNFDNEIIIGVNVHSNKNKLKQDPKKVKRKNKRNNKNDNKKNVANSASQRTSSKANKKVKKRNIRFIKYFILIVILVGAMLCFLLSPIFNIKSIKVSNNSKFSEDTYISLSKIQLDTNIFNISKREIINNIKQNAYVESVEIKRNLPDEILITVEERQATYMIEYNGSYIYMNNQGYFLEISNNPIEVPIIEGISTSEEELQVGNRLCMQDLKKMETVLKIASYAASYNLLDKITTINIENKNNYIIEMAEEEKTVYLGDASNLNERMIKLPIILEKEKGNKGDIMINMDLTQKDPYFSPKD